MQRIVLLVVVLYLVWRVLYVRGRRAARARAAREEEYLSRLWAHGREAPGAPIMADPVGDELIPCDLCGTSVPSRRLETGENGRRVCETCRESSAGRA